MPIKLTGYFLHNKGSDNINIAQQKDNEPNVDVDENIPKHVTVVLEQSPLKTDTVYRSIAGNRYLSKLSFDSFKKIYPFFSDIKTNASRLGKILWLITQTLSMMVWLGVKIVFVYALKHPFLILLNVCLGITLLYIAYSATKLENSILYTQISDQTINEIIAVSKFTRGYDAEKVDKQGDRELLDAGAPKWNQQTSVRAVLFHARKAKLSIDHQAVLLSIVEVESGFNPIARAPTTSACGLFQFVKATGKKYQLQRENCMDPWHNAEAGIKHYIDNYKTTIKDKISKIEGSERVFKLFELGYYIHHDGPDVDPPSDNVKSVILRGTPFLFKVHSILDSELQSIEQMTGTMEYLLVSLNSIGKIIREFVATNREKFSSPKEN